MFLLLAAAGCAPAPVAPDGPTSPIPTPEIDVEAPWHVAHADDTTVALQFEDSPHGVRVDLAPNDRSAVAGVRPIVHGGLVPASRPLVAVGHPDVRAVTIESEGHDLIVRFRGPPLRDVTDHPDAPLDPVIGWIRLRPRNGSWRVVSTGLVQWQLPGDVLYPWQSNWATEGPLGTFELTTDAPTWRSTWSADGQHLDLWPSLDAVQPYPETGVTWRIPDE